MKRDDIIRMAREAGLLDKVDCSNDYFIPGDALLEEIEYFAALVAAAEREACTKLCEQMAWECDDIRRAALEVAAERIRARGNATALLEEEN